MQPGRMGKFRPERVAAACRVKAAGTVLVAAAHQARFAVLIPAAEARFAAAGILAASAFIAGGVAVIEAAVRGRRGRHGRSAGVRAAGAGVHPLRGLTFGPHIRHRWSDTARLSSVGRTGRASGTGRTGGMDSRGLGRTGHNHFLLQVMVTGTDGIGAADTIGVSGTPSYAGGGKSVRPTRGLAKACFASLSRAAP